MLVSPQNYQLAPFLEAFPKGNNFQVLPASSQEGVQSVPRIRPFLLPDLREFAG